VKEASLVKFYLARYFFLAFGLLQALVAIMLLLRFQDSPKNRFAFFVFFTLAMILLSIHLFVFSKVKRVALSKKKIAIINNFKNKEYDWDEVKELKHFPFFNIYSLKLKGKRKKIYFLPTDGSEAVYGIFTGELKLVEKK